MSCHVMGVRNVLFPILLFSVVLVYVTMQWPYESGYPLRTPVPYRETHNTTSVQVQVVNQDADNITVLSYAKIIIVIAYYRTGSTLTGDLLQEHPGTFYLFEPIRNVFNMQNSKRNNATNITLEYLTGKKQWLKSDKHAIQNEIKDLLQCKLKSLSFKSLSDAFITQHSKALRSFSSCFRSKRQNKTQLQTCFQSGITACNKSTAIVLKFIREEMGDTEKLLPYFPNMKIIHLIRDARAMFTSQKSVGHSFLKVDSDEYIQNLCESIERNIESTRSILKQYPGRIRIQRYEDLAEFPMSSAEDIYKFAGFPFEKKVQQFITMNTAGGTDSGTWSVRRKDSTQTASKWRSRIKFDRSKYVYEQCQRSMKILGYLPFKSDVDLKNMTLPSRYLTNATAYLLSQPDTL